MLSEMPYRVFVSAAVSPLDGAHFPEELLLLPQMSRVIDGHASIGKPTQQVLVVHGFQVSTGHVGGGALEWSSSAFSARSVSRLMHLEASSVYIFLRPERITVHSNYLRGLQDIIKKEAYGNLTLSWES